MEDLVNTVLSSMSNINKPQRLFMVALFKVLMVFQGKANFRNMSRYSALNEKRLSRWYRRPFEFAQFNTQLLSHTLLGDQDCIAAIDASFVNKAGKQTDGLGWFYNGSLGQSQRGLEVSMICQIDLKSNTAYSLEALQTIDQKGKTRVDRYAEQVVELAPQLLQQGIVHMAADAYYSKIKFVSAVVSTGLHPVGKLRVDADLQWLYEGPYRGSGRPRKFAGKVDFKKDLDRFEQLDDLDDGVQVYTQVVFSKQFKCSIKLVMLRSVRGDKDSRVLLYSTDTSLDAVRLIRYYKACFQIEFLFRDAKQYTGLTHCQSRRKEAIHTHLNASLVALNLLKLEDQKIKKATGTTVISIASWKRKKFNQHLMERLFQELGLSLKSQKVAQVYDQMSDYGAIAA